MSLSYINSLFAITTKRKCPKEVEKVICTYILTIRGKKKIAQLLQFMPTKNLRFLVQHSIFQRFVCTEFKPDRNVQIDFIDCAFV